MSAPRTHLIWSKKWNAWHKRDDDGQACGYTSDILKAGIFETSTAESYGRMTSINRAVPLQEAHRQITAAVTQKRHEYRTAEQRLATFEQLRHQAEGASA